MPIYCYVEPDSNECCHEGIFSIDQAPRIIRLPDGRVVQKACAGARHNGKGPTCAHPKYPYYETATAVLPCQKAEVEQYCADQGVPTTFKTIGCETRPKIEDRVHRANYHGCRGFYDRDGCYKDAQKT